MILIYSDAGTHKRTAVATTIFLTDTLYLGMLTKAYQDVESTTLGELLGIEQALEYVDKHYPNEKQLAIYTDLETIVYAYRRRLAGEPLPPKTKYYQTWKHILQLSAGKEIEVYHTRGHRTDHNPNKVCDMLSASVLKQLKE